MVSNAPVCLPARSVILSGQYARTCIGRTGNTALRCQRELDGSHGWCFDTYAPPRPAAGRPRRVLPDLTLPELLRRAGYHTRCLGKWHVDAWPDEVGYDDWLICRTHHANSGQLYTHNGGPEFSPQGFGPDFEADRAAAFFADQSAHPGRRPWFCHLNLGPPHMPLADMPDPYLDLYEPGEIRLRENVPQPFDDAKHAETYKTYRWDYRHYLAHLPHADELPEGFNIRALTALYWGAVTWIDDVVGRIVDALEQSGQAEDTLIFFTSDHGDMLGSHDRFGKSSLYEESIRVPLIARGPGLRRGTVASDGVASLVDLAPTLLSAAGIDRPDRMQGRSLLPMLRGEAEGPEAAFIETEHDGIGVRTGRYLYGMTSARDTSRPATQFACDLEKDPHQLSVTTDGELIGDAEALAERLRVWDSRTPWAEPLTP
jgi:choline-sulfatase